MSDLELVEGETYRRGEPDWGAALASLREGDAVEAWWHDHEGVRGNLARNSLGELALSAWTVVHTCGVDDEAEDVHEFTVTKLAPRDPSWVDARAVLTSLGHVWVRHLEQPEDVSGGRDLFVGPDATVLTALGLSAMGPITVLLDADGALTVSAVQLVQSLPPLTADDLVAARSAMGAIATLKGTSDDEQT